MNNINISQESLTKFVRMYTHGLKNNYHASISLNHSAVAGGGSDYFECSLLGEDVEIIGVGMDINIAIKNCYRRFLEKLVIPEVETYRGFH